MDTVTTANEGNRFSALDSAVRARAARQTKIANPYP